MKLSYNWLCEFVDIKEIDPYDLALKLTMSTSEIESVEEVGGNLDGVVIGKILGVKPHPDSDHLTITEIDVGKEKLQIISGAPNTVSGSFVPVALIGTVLPGGMKVKKAKLRGVESFGIVCSEKELGISDDHSGLWILNEEVMKGGISEDELIPGTPIESIFPTKDYIIDIDNKSLTNRPDLWSHYGFAREISAIYGKPLKPLYPEDDFKRILDFTPPEGNTRVIDIEIKDPELCPRYTAIVLENVRIKKSPYFIRRRLYTLGVRPINNMVDVTNWVMLEVGQPLHAFDASKVEGNKIIVRRALDGEKLETLDGVVRELNSENLVIADTEKAVALAGVMGGANSEIDENSTRVIIESANFNPVNIRRTAVSVGLRTEASNRFEKSLDPNYTVQGIVGAVKLMEEISSGIRIASPVIDRDYSKKEKITISLNYDWVDKMLGMKMDRDRIISILEALKFKIEEKSEKGIVVTVPSFRATKDISIPQDLVEEIGRIYGYNNITPELPLIKSTPPPRDEILFFIRDIKRYSSTALGFTEVYTYSFQEDGFLNMFYSDRIGFVRLKNPVGSHLSKMRRSLIPGLFSLIEKNIKYRDEFEVFEVGSIYNPDRKVKYKAGELPEERITFSALILKKVLDRPLFFYLKGKLETLFSHLYIKGISFKEEDKIKWESQSFCRTNLGDRDIYHPTRKAFIVYNDRVFGFISEINPKVLRDFDIDYRKSRVCVFEIDLQMLMDISSIEGEKKKYRVIPKFPEVELALAVVVDEDVSAEEVFSFIKGFESPLLKRVEIFDIYRGKPLAEGKKSLAFNLYYGADDRTLTEDEANEIHESIAKKIREHGWELR